MDLITQIARPNRNFFIVFLLNFNTEKEPHKEILSEKLGHEETRTPTR